MTFGSLMAVFGSMLSLALCDFLYKRAQIRGVHQMAFTTVQATCFTAAVVALAVYSRVQFSVAAVLYSMAAAYTAFPSTVLLLRSLRRGDSAYRPSQLRGHWCPRCAADR